VSGAKTNKQPTTMDIQAIIITRAKTKKSNK
jgi:hypothetical protein